ncbi:ferredoxin [Streptomyces afghaniensis]|uniref:ferredoxin n=1 Tax=Streptomyces afghaniensis TaxID=66865 RepID=UPI00277EB7C4|nr:ferredoxin [Streptomyces afghaniensis]MDQ1014265.1 NAD-dependent dihydropyrimidine dehydrogenase PreA subunit [Streptomyces afghaniensis]
MTYVIAEPRVDVRNKACVEECPVDCIYEGQHSPCIHLDCGAGEPVCPAEAIFYEEDVPPEWQVYSRANAGFFDALGSSGGAARLGPAERDHPLIAALLPRLGKG